MHILCPECGRGHEVAADRLPGPRFKAICRGCGSKFIVETAVCPVCGVFFQQGSSCSCALAQVPADDHQAGQAVAEAARPTVEANNAKPLSPIRPPETGQGLQEQTLRFTGSGGEFFRIWIVNLFLTVVTLGIYAPWAKVRTRCYFYSHTLCGDEPFDYLADPMIILRGYLLVVGGFLFYSLSSVFTPLVSSLVALAFACLFPLLVFKSLRFYARNSAYRNIRFHFLGTLEEAYITYLLLPFLLPFTLGLIFPYWTFRRKRYFFDNMAFGSQRNVFSGSAGDFYRIYLKALLIFVPAVLLLGMVVGGMAMGTGGSLDNSVMPGLIVLLVLAYLGFFVATIFAQQYLQAKTTNYCWHFSSLGPLTFRSSLAAGRLMWIRLTNILALIVSAGLLFPWTKVRYAKYIVASLTVVNSQGLDAFTAGQKESEGALGEAAMDFFDFEVGL